MAHLWRFLSSVVDLLAECNSNIKSTNLISSLMSDGKRDKDDADCGRGL